MANMELIEAKTLSSTTGSVTFSSIPQTYTDLFVKLSVRTTNTAFGETIRIKPNGSSANGSAIILRGYGSGTSSYTYSNVLAANNSLGDGATANTFASIDVYIPNYTSSNYKSFSSDGVSENNDTNGRNEMITSLWSNTAAITSLVFDNDAGSPFSFTSGSTFYLYGISNVTSGTKATGGVVSSDGTYYYHMFPFSGTFTPTTTLTADVLVIAGGGGGGQDGSTNSGGGGAGGLLGYASQSLTAQGYAITVGSGGAVNTQGGNSQFGSLTAAVGGGRAGYGTTNTNGGSGGSGGGGAAANPTPAGTGGSPTSGQGNAGGVASGSPGFCGGGGGGAGAVGGNGTSTNGGAGGVGVNTYSSWAIATQTGANNGYYAGGGGGSAGSGNTGGVGGLGGGGIGTSPDGSGVAIVNATAGLVNTGGGGGGANFLSSAQAGGSGLVIIRYTA